jgi:hypothetical protein
MLLCPPPSHVAAAQSSIGFQPVFAASRPHGREAGRLCSFAGAPIATGSGLPSLLLTLALTLSTTGTPFKTGRRSLGTTHLSSDFFAERD